MTDELGCLLSVVVHKANLYDTKMGYCWMAGLATFYYPRLKKICGNGGYREPFVFDAYKYFGLRVEISKKIKAHSWQVLPKRWMVDRAFAWLNHSRRLSKAECIINIKVKVVCLDSTTLKVHPDACGA